MRGPVTNPTTRALASWLCALWGRQEGARGGASCLGAGRAGSGALPPPTARPLGRAAGAHYPLAVGAGGAGVGTSHQSHSAPSCKLALRAVGAAQGRPGGAPLAWVWGVRGWALSHPRPLVLWGVWTGPTTHWLLVRRVRASGPVTKLHRAPSCELALHAVGAAQGRPGGAPPAWVWGVRAGMLSQPRLPVLWGVRPGPLPTGCGCGGCGRGDPSPTHSARSCELALRAVGAAQGRLGGGASCLGVGRGGSGALPAPTARPLGRAAGAHCPLAVGAEGASVGTRHQTPPRALLPAGFARCGGGTRAPGGGATCLSVGRPGSNALPPPTGRPSRRAARAHYGLAVGAEGAAVGTRHQPHHARSCELALRAVRGGTRAPRGGAS